MSLFKEVEVMSWTLTNSPDIFDDLAGALDGLSKRLKELFATGMSDFIFASADD